MNMVYVLYLSVFEKHNNNFSSKFSFMKIKNTAHLSQKW